METELINKLKSSSKLIGMKQVMKGLSEGIIGCVVISSDADNFIKSKIVNHAKSCNAEIYWFNSMDKLGRICNIDVGAAVVGLMK